MIINHKTGWRYSNLGSFSIFWCLVFLFFVTLHADQLGINISIFNLRVNNLVAVVLGIVFFCLFKNKMLFVNKKTLLVVIIFVLTSIISCYMSVCYYRTIAYLGLTLFTILFYFILPYLMMISLDEKVVIRFYCFSFVCVGLYAVLQFLLSLIGVKDPFVYQKMMSFMRPNAMSYEPSYYALYMTPYTFFVNTLYLTRYKISFNRVLFANIILVLSTSTGVLFAYIAYIAVIFLYCLNHNEKELKFDKRIISIFISLMVLVFLSAIVFWDFFALSFFKFFINGTNHHSFISRFDGIISGWKVFCAHPVFGVGLGGVSPYLAVSFGASDIVAFSKKLDHIAVFPELLSSLGIMGGTLFVILLRGYYKNYRRAKSLSEGEDLKIILSFYISFLMMLIILQYHPGLLRSYVWVHIGITYGYMKKIILNNKAILHIEK